MQNHWRKKSKKGIALAAAFALTVSGVTVTEAEAASKWAPKLSATNISLKKGETKKIKIIKKKAVKVKKVTWKIDTGSKKVKVLKKTRTYIKFKALKTGNVSINAKIKTNKGTFTRKAKVGVTASKKATPKPDNTKQPDKTAKPEGTPGTPLASGAPSTGNPSVPGPDTPVTGEPGDTKKPDETKEPDETKKPDETKEPDETKKPDETKEPDETKKPDETKEPVQSEAPAPTKVPSAPTSAPAVPPVVAPSQNQPVQAVKASWNKGVITNLTSAYAGCKVKISMEIREEGVDNPTGQAEIATNYNGYPTLAKVDLSSEWTPVEFVHRFNEFTASYPSMYFNGNAVTDAMTMYFRNFKMEIVEGPDPLGGTCLTPSNWHKGIIASLRVNNDGKYYQNKQIGVSFKIRVTNLDSEDNTCKLLCNHVDPAVPVASSVPLTTEWSEVDFTYAFDAFNPGQDWPSIYLENTDLITGDMEVYVKDVQITDMGASPTPTPKPTLEPGSPEIGETDDKLTMRVFESFTSDDEKKAFKFSDMEGYPATFNIKNYSDVTVNYRLYDTDGNIITTDFAALDNSGSGKICLNKSTPQNSTEYNYGWGDGYEKDDFHEIVSVNQYGTASSTFTLTDATPADCINSQIINKSAIGRVEIISIVMTKKKDSGDEPSGGDAAPLEDLALTLDNTNTSALLPSGDRTLDITGGVATLSVAGKTDASAADGIVVKVTVPKGRKLQDYTSIKCKIGAHKALYGKNIVVCVDSANPETPSEDNLQTHAETKRNKIGGLSETIPTTATEFDIPLDFTGYSGTADLTGTVSLILGVYHNDGDETSYGSTSVSFSDVSLIAPREETKLALTSENTTSLMASGTCSVTNGVATMDCGSGEDGVVIQFTVPEGKKLQDFKEISFTYTSNHTAAAYGKNVMVALNKWDLSKPNNDGNGVNYGFASQEKIATKSGTINAGDNTYKMSLDFSAFSSDISGTVALMIGMSYNNDQFDWSISDVSLWSVKSDS